MTASVDRWLARALVALLALAGAPASAEDEQSSALGFERTPPRLSFSDGEVSYWRPGDEEWTAARINTPLAAGDELSTGAGANLELQIGARAHLRAGEATQLALTTLEPDYLQVELLAGTASLDLRELDPGQTLEIDTPNAAFTIERPGYYRIEVADDSTAFTSRRGGRATVQTKQGLPTPISANEQIVVTGTDAPRVASQGAPALDDWDRWNYSRSERQTSPHGSRYVSDGVYGADDLDAYGSWRTVPSYGAVWVPRVAVGWAPYSTGRWIHDPYYGWTWVDDAPWGWAPFHYGRWVYVGNYWAWSPGPRLVRAYYSPALVAFYSSPGFSVSVSFGRPALGWVALGWGEPIVPWWGPRGCRGVARWTGWGGPRVVNNIVIRHNRFVNVNHIERHQHFGRRGALVAVERGRFGHGDVRHARIARVDSERLAPVRGGELGVRANRAARVGSERRGTRPSREVRERRVVTRQNQGRGRGDAQTRAGARNVERRGERRLGEVSAPPPTREARAERAGRRRPVSEGAPTGRSRNRQRAATPPRPSGERGAPRERRGSVSSAPRDDRSQDRPSAAARERRVSRDRAARGQRPEARARRERSVEPREPRAPSMDTRRQRGAEPREPRQSRTRAAREAPARMERGPSPQAERAAPRSERPDSRRERVRESQPSTPRGSGDGGGGRRGRGRDRGEGGRGRHG